MTIATRATQIEYGDFQTPIALANKVCQKLIQLGIAPDIVIEPTCGTGAFVEASAHLLPSAQKIIGIDINPAHLDELANKKATFPNNHRVELRQGDFFTFAWEILLRNLSGSVLVLGNFPWVTNAQQGTLGGSNLPKKANIHKHNGLDALTGKSNFDISEWMLIQTTQWFKNRKGYLALICKTTVARKFLHYLDKHQVGLAHAAIYGLDAKHYFGVAVEACLLVCQLDLSAHHYDYAVYPNLDDDTHYQAGQRQGLAIRDLDGFAKHSYLLGESEMKWRSGVKHDCAEIMELQKVNGQLVNGLEEVVEIEPDYLFPLLKGSDVANNRVTTTTRYVVATQRSVGEPTHLLKTTAPKTWAYLENHAEYLDNRKSRIYRDNPRFSMFGIGPYSFTPWKIAISGLYKSLTFRLVGEIEGKPALFDDTVYFLGFDCQEDACSTLAILTSRPTINFLSALIFWDEKRPIKSSILNRLNLRQPQTRQDSGQLFLPFAVTD